MSCSHCQELCQQTKWLLICCTRVNNQSEARSASWPNSWQWLQLINFHPCPSLASSGSMPGARVGCKWRPAVHRTPECKSGPTLAHSGHTSGSSYSVPYHEHLYSLEVSDMTSGDTWQWCPPPKYMCAASQALSGFGHSTSTGCLIRHRLWPWDETLWVEVIVKSCVNK